MLLQSKSMSIIIRRAPRSWDEEIVHAATKVAGAHVPPPPQKPLYRKIQGLLILTNHDWWTISTAVTKTELAYIAGIIDGEGTITLMRHHSNQTPSPEISVANTSLRLLQHLKKTIGSGVIIRKKIYSKKHTPSYTWTLRSNAALELMKAVLPWLLIKDKRAQLILKDYKRLTPRNGRYTKQQLKRKVALVNKVRKLNERLY